jgi:uncharacterized protein YggE
MAPVTTIGRGEVGVPPDEAALVLTIDAVRPTAAEALRDIGERARSLVALLDELGIESGARQTTGVSVSEEGEHREGVWQLRGYRASERLKVRTGDAVEET